MDLTELGNRVMSKFTNPEHAGGYKGVDPGKNLMGHRLDLKRSRDPLPSFDVARLSDKVN